MSMSPKMHKGLKQRCNLGKTRSAWGPVWRSSTWVEMLMDEGTYQAQQLGETFPDGTVQIQKQKEVVDKFGLQRFHLVKTLMAWTETGALPTQQPPSLFGLWSQGFWVHLLAEHWPSATWNLKRHTDSSSVATPWDSYSQPYALPLLFPPALPLSPFPSCWVASIQRALTPSSSATRHSIWIPDSRASSPSLPPYVPSVSQWGLQRGGKGWEPRALLPHWGPCILPGPGPTPCMAQDVGAGRWVKEGSGGRKRTRRGKREEREWR